MSEERESAEETEEAVAEEAVIGDRFTDDELRERLTSVLMLIRTAEDEADKATKEDRARIAGEVDSAVEAVIRRRNEIADWAAASPTASATGQRHVEQELDTDEDADEEPFGLQDRLATPLSTPPTRRRR